MKSLDDFSKKYASLIAKNLFSWKQEIKKLTNKQRSVLTAIAVLTKGEELFSANSRKKYHLPASSSLATAIDSLIKKGIIIKEEKRYKVLNPVLKAWLGMLS